MINEKTKQRELCYVVYIDNIEPIVGSDNCEAAIVGGWKIMVRKGSFKPGDPAIYFEIDSKVDTNKPEFNFLEKKHGAIKTQKYTFGGKNPGFYSQGLLMTASDFGWTVSTDEPICIIDDKNVKHIPNDESMFLTERLGVTYAVEEDNKRKAKSNPDAKINAALARHPKIAKKFGKTIKKHKILRKLFLFFFGKKNDARSWPNWVVKTDEERVQNMAWILEDKSEWIATEKIDGTSTTFTMKRVKNKKYDFYICSRNVVFDKPDKPCFYDTNVYLEMAQKYDIENVLKQILDSDNSYEWVTIQGETYGEGVQKRTYGIKDHDFKAFNFITSKDGRWNSHEAAEFLSKYNIPWVPIIDEHFILPDTVDELLTIATGDSVLDGGMREGLVFRSQDGTRSFKAVSNEFIVKYHG
jgi:hypothetical protein